LRKEVEELEDIDYNSLDVFNDINPCGHIQDRFCHEEIIPEIISMSERKRDAFKPKLLPKACGYFKAERFLHFLLRRHHRATN
jgi:hypothetical protein